MKIQVKNLQDAVNTINITESMQKEIIQNVKIRTKRKKYRFFKVAAAVILIVILSGIIGVPVRAVVCSLLQERMEQVPKEELTAMLDDLRDQKTPADSLSRAYTEEEKIKMAELAKKYQEGTFPEGELMKVYSIEEAESLELCILIPDCIFYLPDRELTEEEMLQIIDFYAKREYALTERYKEEHADEIAKQKENTERQKAEIIESGGITEEEAVEIAQEWFVKIYGVTGDNMEIDYYFEGDTPIVGKTGFYHIIWRDIPSGKNYSLYIYAKDGSLSYAYLGTKNMDGNTFAVTEASVLLPELKERAVSFVKEQLQQTYEDVYCAYYSVNDVLNVGVSFIFVREDNIAFKITYYWNGIFKSFEEGQFSSYQEEYEDMKELAEAVECYKHKGEEIEINMFFEKIENME